MSKSFSLARYKAAQMAAPVEPAADSGATGQSYDFDSLEQALSTDPFQTMQQLATMIPDDYTITWTDGSPQSQPTSGPAADILKPDTWTTMTDPREKQQFLLAVLNALPDASRGSEMNSLDSDTITGTPQTARVPADVQASVSNSNEIIKRIAEAFVVQHAMKTKTASKKPYNRLKTAQFTEENGSYVFGPESQHQFPSVMQVGNQWNLIERNKSWGIKPHEFPGIDFEEVWRENVMDRYYPAEYTAEGEYVGGYIQDRFEVDKNIPELNNMQLKPGQRRKPILPEYGNIGSRMEAKHEEDGKGKVFNWNKASAQSRVKHAEIDIEGGKPATKPFNRLANSKKKVAQASDPATVVVYPTNSTEAPFRARAFIKGAPEKQVWDVNPEAAFYTLCKVYGLHPNKVGIDRRNAPSKVINDDGPSQKVAYAPSKPKNEGGLNGGKPAQGVWNCPGCGSLRGAHETTCGGCGMSKGNAPSSFAIQPGGSKPGQRPRWNQPNNNPISIMPGQQMRHASSLLPSDHMADEKDNDALSQVLEHHKKRQRSFDALCGGPEETTPAMVEPIRR